jgi:iron complex outermembrane receptor protein
MRPVACIFLFLACISCMTAQDMAPDTMLNLNDVNIYSSRISKFAKGQELVKIDSLTRTEYPAGSLAELMTGFTSSYIRNYGQGTLSTLSFRGTSANHAGLLWNGIRVSPPNIGYVDLSLVQGNFFNDISILYGGASPMFGSGSIGGGIHLESRPVFDRSGFDLGLCLSAGSFGTMALEGNAIVFDKKFYSRTAYSFFDAANDFSYANLQDKNENLTHAAIFKGGFIQDFAYRLPGNQYLMASAWFQYADREIPPTLTEEKSEAVQMDRSWRTLALWKDYNERNILEAKLAYFNEFTLYKDPLATVYSTIKSQSAVGSFESTWDIFENSALFAGSQFTYEYAGLVNYTQPETQDNLAVYASFRQNLPKLKWQLSINGRQEFLSEFHSPFLFSAGAEGKIWRFISGRLNVSRNFRAPTLNERFWQPGGNPDLKPEESWNEEAGISTENKFPGSDIKFTFTAYNSRVQNWILWLPVGNTWYVQNAQEVWSRGTEIAGNQSFALHAVNLFLAESWSYTKSINEKKLFDLDASYKKQLIYTPLNRIVIKAGAIYKGFNLTLKGDYTGEVFTSKDNVESLPAYFLLDMVFSKSFKIKNEYPLTIQFNLNNMLNTEYQVTPFRPMPGFNFLVTVKAEISRQSSIVSR